MTVSRGKFIWVIKTKPIEKPPIVPYYRYDGIGQSTIEDVHKHFNRFYYLMRKKKKRGKSKKKWEKPQYDNKVAYRNKLSGETHKIRYSNEHHHRLSLYRVKTILSKRKNEFGCLDWIICLQNDFVSRAEKKDLANIWRNLDSLYTKTFLRRKNYKDVGLIRKRSIILSHLINKHIIYLIKYKIWSYVDILKLLENNKRYKINLKEKTKYYISIRDSIRFNDMIKKLDRKINKLSKTIFKARFALRDVF